MIAAMIFLLAFCGPLAVFLWIYVHNIRAINARTKRAEELATIAKDEQRPFHERHAAMQELFDMRRS